MKKQNVKTVIELPEFKIRKIEVPIVGISPLIVHKFSQKVIDTIEAKLQGKAKNAKHSIRIPEAEFEAAKHVSAEGWEGFRADGIKQCIVRGAKATGLVMTDVRAAVFVEPDCKKTNLFRIIGKSNLRVDPVRVGMGGADLRYRPEYQEWSAKLSITFNEGLISKEQLIQAIYAGGYGTGIGEWRPEKGGNYGRFTVEGM